MQKLLKCGQTERAAKIFIDEFNFVDLVEQRCESFGKSIDDLGNTVRNLYNFDLLMNDDVKIDIGIFENYAIKRKFLSKAFMFERGVCYGFIVEKMIVCWLVP